jgi:hypothetical protein
VVLVATFELVYGLLLYYRLAETPLGVGMLVRALCVLLLHIPQRG